MFKAFREKTGSWLKDLFSFTKKVYLPGFEGISLYETSIYLIKGFKKNSITDRAYAISFKFILASFPLIIFLFSLIPHIPISGLQEDLLYSVMTALPDQLSSYLSSFLEDLILYKKTTIMSIGFLLTIFFASNTMNAILKGFSSSYHLNRIKNKPVNMRLWAIVLMFVFSLLMISVALVFILGGHLLTYLQNSSIISSNAEIWLIWSLEWLIILLLFMLAIAILYNIGNTGKEKWKFLSPGVIISTLMIWTFSELFSLFVNYLAPFNKLYGSLGTIIILLLFIYYCFAILLIGFELNLSIQSAKKRKIKVITS